LMSAGHIEPVKDRKPSTAKVVEPETPDEEFES